MYYVLLGPRTLWSAGSVLFLLSSVEGEGTTCPRTDKVQYGEPKSDIRGFLSGTEDKVKGELRVRSRLVNLPRMCEQFTYLLTYLWRVKTKEGDYKIRVTENTETSYWSFVQRFLLKT